MDLHEEKRKTWRALSQTIAEEGFVLLRTKTAFCRSAGNVSPCSVRRSAPPVRRRIRI